MSKIKKEKENELEIYVDGACRGNPGPGAWAFILVNQNGQRIHDGTGFIGNTTNNIAEYTAIVNSLRVAKKFTNSKIKVFSDSQLVIKQLNKKFKITKPHLLELYKKVLELRKEFASVEFIQVSRNHPKIEICDALCNKHLNKLQ
ncbi:MAG: ribonuclease HI family protein [Candidatus Hermodarchaeota archaeon]